MQAHQHKQLLVDGLRLAAPSAQSCVTFKVLDLMVPIPSPAAVQEAVKLLLSHKCNIKRCAMDDMNALHFASQKGNTEILRLLITAGVWQILQTSFAVYSR